MKTDDERTGALLEPLRKATADAPDDATRERMWREIQRRRGARTARTWLPWVLAVGAAATAAVALVAVRGSTDVPAHGPAPAPGPAVVASPSSGALPSAPVTGRHERTLPSGARIAYDADVELLVATPDATRLSLARGEVESVVPKLRPGQSYVVETARAKVEVRGTVFVVGALADGTTRVQVREGRVVVTPTDWRVAAVVSGGESLEVAECPATVDAALEATDWRCRVDAFLAQAQAAAEVVGRRNALLRAGRLLAEHDPARAARHFGELRAAGPHAVHAEEVAFREARALRAAGRAAEADAAARTFREAFPRSPFGAP